MRPLWLCLLLFTTSLYAAQAVHRWVDAQGTLQFRDDIYGFDTGKEQGSSQVMQSLLLHRKA